MNCLSWNCRGLGIPRAVRCLGDVLRTQKPDIVFLIETLSLDVRINELCRKFGYAHHFTVDSIGRSGGLALMWKHNVLCSVVGHSSNFIDAHILNQGVADWRLTGFYGYPDRSQRRESWSLIRSLSSLYSLPWCIVGDFNDLLSASDKKGQVPHPQWLLEGFKNVISDCALTEVDLHGGSYTWEKSKGKPTWVREKLDRVFGCNAWWAKFPSCKLSLLHTVVSDHNPIFLDLVSTEFSTAKFRFKFENTWLREQSFHDDVVNFWKSIPFMHLLSRLESVSSFMAKWGLNFFHKFREK